MGLKIASIEDLDLVHAMAMKFVNSSPYKEHYSEEKITNIAKALIEDQDKVIILYDDVAFIAGIASPFVYGTELSATELAWWVEPDHRKSNIGKELLEAFEFWAKKIGCSMITMIGLDDKLGKFYEKQGYVLTERAYMKVI